MLNAMCNMRYKIIFKIITYMCGPLIEQNRKCSTNYVLAINNCIFTVRNKYK